LRGGRSRLTLSIRAAWVGSGRNARRKGTIGGRPVADWQRRLNVWQLSAAAGVIQTLPTRGLHAAHRIACHRVEMGRPLESAAVPSKRRQRENQDGSTDSPSTAKPSWPPSLSETPRRVAPRATRAGCLAGTQHRGRDPPPRSLPMGQGGGRMRLTTWRRRLHSRGCEHAAAFKEKQGNRLREASQ
jgi:hypothetical protein